MILDTSQQAIDRNGQLQDRYWNLSEKIDVVAIVLVLAIAFGAFMYFIQQATS